MLIRALCPASLGWWQKCTIKKRFYTRCPVPGWCDCFLSRSLGNRGQESALSRGIGLYAGFVWAPNAVPHVMSFGFGPHHAQSFLPNLVILCEPFITFVWVAFHAVTSLEMTVVLCLAGSPSNCSDNTCVTWCSGRITGTHLLSRQGGAACNVCFF